MSADLTVGERVRGKITLLRPFGAFVEIENCAWAGLVLIPEISWTLIQHPQDVLTIGQEMEFEVTAVVVDRHQIGLSIKRCQKNPWLDYSVGQSLSGVITSFHAVGASARLKDNPAIEGLIPRQELTCDLTEGQTVPLYISSLIPERGRMTFSLCPGVSEKSPLKTNDHRITDSNS